MNEQINKICPVCAAAVAPNSTVCPVCGAALQPSVPVQPAQPVQLVAPVQPAAPVPAAGNVCRNCGTPMQPGQSFCAVCGQKADLVMDANVNNAISQFNAGVEQQAKKKKTLPLILGIAAAVILVIILAVSMMKPKVESVSISQSSVELRVDDTTSVSCTIYPVEAAEDAEVTWSSSDSSVARVSGGQITAVGEGTCTITVTADGVVDTMTVTVKRKGPDFNQIFNTYCQSTWAEVGSDGSYLLIDTNPYNWDDDGLAYPAAYDAVKNINVFLGLPESLITKIGETRGIDGKQSETYDDVGITVSWSYHPDKGLEIMYALIN